MTLRDLERDGVSLSRVEERRGWLGRSVVDPSERGAFTQRDEPTDREEGEAGS